MQTVTYEQCPWHEPHVREIYPRIGEILADGEWHDFSNSTHRCQYRVYRDRFFQAVISETESPLFHEALQMEPPDTEDDAAWILAFDESDEAYVLASLFTRTFGPFSGIRQIDDLLNYYGLRLETIGNDIYGCADLLTLDPAEVKDAMDRLHGLERITLAINKEIDARLGNLWDEHTREMLQGIQGKEDSEETFAMPASLRPGGPKRRRKL